MGEDDGKKEEKAAAAEAAPAAGDEKKSKKKKKNNKPAEPTQQKKSEDGNASSNDDKGNAKNEEKAVEKPPPPPEEVVMGIHLHCQGCVRKVLQCLRGFEGVEDVTADYRTHKVVVKGVKAAENPMKVVERIVKKTGKKVELISPKVQDMKQDEKKQDKPNVDNNSSKDPEPIIVVLGIQMHCEACSQEMKKRIQKMKGVATVEADIVSSQVTVKGMFEAADLASYVCRRIGKQVAIIKQELIGQKVKPETPKAKEALPQPPAAAEPEAKIENKENGQVTENTENKTNTECEGEKKAKKEGKKKKKECEQKDGIVKEEKKECEAGKDGEKKEEKKECEAGKDGEKKEENKEEKKENKKKSEEKA